MNDEKTPQKGMETNTDSFPEMEGRAAPPQDEEHLIFEKAWERRAFGLVVALHNRGLFEWREFQQNLIEEIDRWEREHNDLDDWNYYKRWLAALESLLDEKGIAYEKEL